MVSSFQTISCEIGWMVIMYMNLVSCWKPCLFNGIIFFQYQSDGGLHAWGVFKACGTAQGHGTCQPQPIVQVRCTTCMCRMGRQRTCGTELHPSSHRGRLHTGLCAACVRIDWHPAQHLLHRLVKKCTASQHLCSMYVSCLSIMASVSPTSQ